MHILGLNYYFHDSSACLVRDGELLAAVEEERLNREKHTSAFPARAIAQCLEIGGVEVQDIDVLAVSVRPRTKAAAKLAYVMRHAPRALRLGRSELSHAYFRQRGLSSWYQRVWGTARKRPRIVFVPHHLAHAAGSFLVSPFERAAVLSLDGSGEWATSLHGLGEGTALQVQGEDDFPHSLGSFYEAATEFCGFRPNYDEGKTMGLAPFGDPEAYYDEVARLVKLTADGGVRLDLSYFDFPYGGTRRCAEKFHRVFGPPRAPGEAFTDRHENVAAAFQRVLEERVLDRCRRLRRSSGARALVLAGGVALNSVMNGRIVRESGFDDVYVMPAAGDNGTAIGAAYYVWNTVLGNPRSTVHDTPYLGREYAESEIEARLREGKLPFTRVEDIAGTTARLLQEGKIVGWFQGRMEIGPRALGNRSILANPTLSDMKRKLNAEVKHREAYRPFAPATPVEERARHFEITGEAPFMLKVCYVRPDSRARIPAVTHVDGSARLQTVDRRTNPLFHRLLSEFGALSEVPVLLNTSFNVQGEPIVESPLDAVRCFYSTGIDALAIGPYLLTKGQ